MKKIVLSCMSILGLVGYSFAGKISLQFNNARLITVVDAISQVANINVIWDKDAIGKKDTLVNILIPNPVEDLTVLNKILNENGLILVKDKKTNIYFIKEASEIRISFPQEVQNLLGNTSIEKIVSYINSTKTDFATVEYAKDFSSIYYKDTKENIENVKAFVGPYIEYLKGSAAEVKKLFETKGNLITKYYPISYEDFLEISSEINSTLSPFGKVVYDKDKKGILITDFSDNIQKAIPIVSKKLQSRIVTKCFYVREMEPGIIYNTIKSDLSEVGNITFNYKKYDVATIKTPSGQPPQVVDARKPIKVGEVKEDKLLDEKKVIDPNQTLQSQFLSGEYAISALPRVCISDYPEVIDKIKYKHYTELLEKPYQIVIEARIVEVSSNNLKDLGIQWGGLASNIDNNNTKIISGTNSPSYLTTFRPNSAYAVDFPASVNPNMGFSLGFILGGAQNFLDIRLSALQKIGKSKLLSAPKVLTTDGETALIRQGYEIPYITGATATTPGNVNFKNAVMQLKVTPFTTKEGDILMNIEISKDELDFTQSVQGVPPIKTKTVMSKVSVKDGSTLVIGGIIEKKEQEVKTGVPGLMNIPILGNLFKNNYTNNESTELLIFLTPKIIYE